MNEKDDNNIDVLSGEVASVRSTTKGKYYNDALKLCLASKQHLNHLLSLAPNITSKEICKIKLPMIQIMGMNCHISLINLVDKNVYVVQDVYSFKYPKTIKQVEEGGVEKCWLAFLFSRICFSKLMTFIPTLPMTLPTKWI